MYLSYLVWKHSCLSVVLYNYLIHFNALVWALRVCLGTGYSWHWNDSVQPSAPRQGDSHLLGIHFTLHFLAPARSHSPSPPANPDVPLILQPNAVSYIWERRWDFYCPYLLAVSDTDAEVTCISEAISTFMHIGRFISLVLPEAGIP